MADRQKTTDLTPKAEKGDHDLLEIIDNEKPIVDLTPKAEEGDHDLLEIIDNEKPIRPRARPENRTPKTEVQKFRNGGVAEARGMKSA
jgi:hypothetical protein